MPTSFQADDRRRARTANNEKRDTRLLYIMVLVSPRTHYSPQGVRGDTFLVDVMRKQPLNSLEQELFLNRHLSWHPTLCLTGPEEESS